MPKLCAILQLASAPLDITCIPMCVWAEPVQYFDPHTRQINFDLVIVNKET